MRFIGSRPGHQEMAFLSEVESVYRLHVLDWFPRRISTLHGLLKDGAKGEEW
jgi:hypothetical protein